MKTVDSQDRDGDGLIDSEGWPDQTFDAWSVKGASAYCGGLHVAVLQCVSQMANIFGETKIEKEYEAKLSKAKNAYDAKLWNGKYYNYDSSRRNYSDSIMADMCCGHWFLRCSGFKYEVSFDHTNQSLGLAERISFVLEGIRQRQDQKLSREDLRLQRYQILEWQAWSREWHETKRHC